MTMNFLPHEWPVDFETSDFTEVGGSASGGPVRRTKKGVKILEEKLRIPEFENVVTRPRLNKLLERSAGQFGATLICGRAGTGKTVLAAGVSARQKDAVWYSIEPADSGWEAFSSYFAAGLLDKRALREGTRSHSDGANLTRTEIAEFLASCLSRLERGSLPRPLLITLDNIHHLYDAGWFSDFFNQLIFSLTPDVHVLMLSRSKPPAPLWRLRSKQMLNVIDENVIGFTPAEAKRLCKLRGVQEKLASEAHSRSCGRISKLIESLEDISRDSQ